MQERTLIGEVALVTGASRNIGRAIAVRLAEAGADVAVTARSDQDGCRETAALVEDAGGNATVVMGDLGMADDVAEIATQAKAALGPVSILVNNASIRPNASFLELDWEDWERVHAVDLRGVAESCQVVLPEMVAAQSGTIVNIIGQSIYTGAPEKVHVMANKAGLVGLTRGLAQEFGPDGIRVNAACLGLIDTDRDVENYPDWEQYRQAREATTALGRLGTPTEVADAAAFLAGPAASYITGQVLHVNGGSYPISNTPTG